MLARPSGRSVVSRRLAGAIGRASRTLKRLVENGGFAGQRMGGGLLAARFETMPEKVGVRLPRYRAG